MQQLPNMCLSTNPMKVTKTNTILIQHREGKSCDGGCEIIPLNIFFPRNTNQVNAAVCTELMQDHSQDLHVYRSRWNDWIVWWEQPLLTPAHQDWCWGVCWGPHTVARGGHGWSCHRPWPSLRSSPAGPESAVASVALSAVYNPSPTAAGPNTPGCTVCPDGSISEGEDHIGTTVILHCVCLFVCFAQMAWTNNSLNKNIYSLHSSMGLTQHKRDIHIFSDWSTDCWHVKARLLLAPRMTHFFESE